LLDIEHIALKSLFIDHQAHLATMRTLTSASPASGAENRRQTAMT
jgi:hypothetical protein